MAIFDTTINVIEECKNCLQKDKQNIEVNWKGQESLILLQEIDALIVNFVKLISNYKTLDVKVQEDLAKGV